MLPPIKIPGQKGTAKILEPGWSTPIKLGFNDEGWEDSPYIARDGKQILFFYHPNRALADPKQVELVTGQVLANPEDAIRSGLDGKIYFSNRPFTSKSVHPVSKDKRYPSADACPYLAPSGELYYCSTLESWVQGKDLPPTVYVDGRRLDFGTGAEESIRIMWRAWTRCGLTVPETRTSA